MADMYIVVIVKSKNINKYLLNSAKNNQLNISNAIGLIFLGNKL